MKSFIVTIELESLDQHGIESGFITTTYIPVIANDEVEASRKAVVYQSDAGKAQENTELVWECREPQRNLVWKVTKCLPITEDDKDFFLSLTQGLSTARVCK
jgi:hypothetical protein